jgi:hypothetical protein
MKKIFAVTLAATLLLVITDSANAQSRKATSGGSYNTALGLGLDFGDGSTLVGPSVKHFFSTHDVGKAEILFGDGLTNLSLYYQYHGNIPNASGLNWTLGLGGSLFFADNNTTFGFRPTAGLDYKIPNVPIQFEFDWRPLITVTDGSDFTPARFGFGFRYCF